MTKILDCLEHGAGTCRNADTIDELRARAERAEARLQEYQDDTARVLSEQCPTDERHCGCVPILRKEIARLSDIEAKAIEQSEDVQTNWLSPFEAVQLRKEIARLKEERRWIDPKVEMPDQRDDPVDENGYGERRSRYWGEFLHKNGDLSYGEVSYNYSRGRWEVCDEGIWGRVNVNHYHLLPEPPAVPHD